ncbi:hypothetical protein DD592_27215 [Enterobacter cloacae complex sp. 2DZ2F20B]|nr:hypothetical protein DD592_27215 [Enterobacter cloacae complex sp. 2DZ2F20B]
MGFYEYVNYFFVFITLADLQTPYISRKLRNSNANTLALRWITQLFITRVKHQRFISEQLNVCNFLYFRISFVCANDM